MQVSLLSKSSNLDFLRMCAVLMVAVAHAPALLGLPISTALHNFGVGGVVFFFVHTSLVLLLSMERSPKERFAINFYIRRAFRIYPLCWACILFVLITGLSDKTVDELHAMGRWGVLVNAALLENIFHRGEVVGPLWSLPWEIQMYLVLPALFLLLSRKNKWWIPVGLWANLTSLAVIVTVLHVPYVKYACSIIPLFMGGLVAYQRRSVRPRFSAVWWPPFLFVLTAARVFFLRGVWLDYPRNAFVNSCTCLVLGFAIPMFRQLEFRPLVALSNVMAKYSYGIYLFHAPMIVLFSERLVWLPSWIKVGGCTLSIAVLCYGLFHLIEDPFIRLGKSLTSGAPKRYVQPVNDLAA